VPGDLRLVVGRLSRILWRMCVAYLLAEHNISTADVNSGCQQRMPSLRTSVTELSRDVGDTSG
jgi:hypothetical protein